MSATCRTSRACAGGAGALVTASGRIIAGEPYGVWPERVALPPGADRVRLEDGREMMVEPLAEGFLLHAPRKGAAAPRRSALSLRFMGDGAPGVLLNGAAVPVTLRPAELLTALALNPDGLTAEQLALLLYGDDGNPTTVRGEVLRLRTLIGADVLRTRPYRLDASVDADFQAVRRALRARQPAEALRTCAGRCSRGRTPPRSASCATSWRSGCAAPCSTPRTPTCWRSSPPTPSAAATSRRTTGCSTSLPASDGRRPEIRTRLSRLLSEA